jgi:hypothetical protein
VTPKQVLLTDPMFQVLDDGSERLIPAQNGELSDAGPEPTNLSDATIYQRGLVLRWGRNSAVEITTGKVAIADHTERDVEYVRLQRGDINLLIRDLRKARDQVFGADA